MVDYDKLSEDDRRTISKDAQFAINRSLVMLFMTRGKSQADFPFFAHVAIQLELVESWAIDTACTDGARIIYNPHFIARDIFSPDLEQVRGVIMHEVCHVIMKHFERVGDRNKTLANVAMDLEINQILVDSGCKLPQFVCLPGRAPFADIPPDKTFEEYYEMLLKNAKYCAKLQMDGQDPGGMGACEPGPGEQGATSVKVDSAVLKAAAASKSAGTLSARLAQLVNDIAEPAVPWQSLLQEFVSRCAAEDYSWRRPNRRYIHSGMYLPSLYSESLGDVIFMIDSSGSCCDPDIFGRFQAECRYICETYGCHARVYYHEVDVTKTVDWNPGDSPLSLEPLGGGGTSHIPVFEQVRKDEMDPVVVIAMTDMESSFPKEDPGYPVIWVNIGSRHHAGPGWGRVVHVEERRA